MNNEELQRTVGAVVERAIGDQVNLKKLGLERIEPDASLIDDLGIDSVDLLTVIYDIEVELSIKLPIQEWLKDSGGAAGPAALTVGALVSHIVGFLQKTPVETA